MSTTIALVTIGPVPADLVLWLAKQA